MGAALLLLVSKYRFGDVLAPGKRALDPSRVPAQVVSGIGFIGGGLLIFVRGDIVRGLTTAALVCVTAAVGTACGAGLALLACATTAGHFAVVLAYPAIAARLPATHPLAFAVRVVYEGGRGILRDVLAHSTRRGFGVQRVTAHQLETRGVGGVPAVVVTLEVHGQPDAQGLVTTLDELPGVLEVTTRELGLRRRLTPATGKPGRRAEDAGARHAAHRGPAPHRAGPARAGAARQRLIDNRLPAICGAFAWPRRDDPVTRMRPRLPARCRTRCAWCARRARTL